MQRHWWWLWCFILLLYLVWLKPPISRAYVDFGDGNYQYISWRLSQGVHLYTDILSPQPPLHLWLGCLVVKLSRVSGWDSLEIFRWSTHFIRAGSALCLFLIGWRLFRSGGVGWLASAVFLFLPEGYRWSSGYQSEHLEILFLLTGLLASLSGHLWSRCVAVACGICALWTNMSSLPFSAILFLHALICPQFSIIPLAAGAGFFGLMLGGSFLLAGRAFWENVWSNQVASIPSQASAWMASLSEQGTTILTLEGGFILLAILGLYRFIHSSGCGSPATESFRSRALVVLFGIASLGSGIYVVKGGTVDYIFSLGEPLIALFSSWALISWIRQSPAWNGGCHKEPHSAHWIRIACQSVLIIGLVAILGWQPYRLARGLHFQMAPGVDLADQSQGRIVEFSDLEVHTLLRVIRELAPEGSTLWAPPFLAALSQHPIAMDLSETYLWWVRWQREIQSGIKDPGVDRMLSGLTDLIEKKALPLLLINDRTGQWGMLLVPGRQLNHVPIRTLDPRIERLQSMLEQHYQPIRKFPGSDQKLYFQGWNERLEVWVPKGGVQVLSPWVKEGFSAGS